MEAKKTRKPWNSEAHQQAIAIAAAAKVDPKTARKVLDGGAGTIRSRPLANAIAEAARDLGIAIPGEETPPPAVKKRKHWRANITPLCSTTAAVAAEWLVANGWFLTVRRARKKFGARVVSIPAPIEGCLYDLHDLACVYERSTSEMQTLVASGGKLCCDEGGL